MSDPWYRVGETVREILDEAVSGKADLLTVGTHGRSGFERLVLGSVTEKLLRKAGCPVLTVPRHNPEAVPAGPELFKRILCHRFLRVRWRHFVRHGDGTRERCGTRGLLHASRTTSYRCRDSQLMTAWTTRSVSRTSSSGGRSTCGDYCTRPFQRPYAATALSRR